MNERIRELVRQADVHILPDESEYGHTIIGLEKFAELIVKECVAQCWTVSELESKGSVVSECAKRIRKHFGVE